MRMQEADHIIIPLLNGDYALAQIAYAQGPLAMLLITHRPYVKGDTTFAIAKHDVLARIVANLDTLPPDHWRIIGYEPIPDLGLHKIDLTHESVANHDPAIMEAFMNAIHGLYPWDGFPDPAFFTDMLRQPAKLPPRARMTADFPKPDASE